MTEEKTQFKNFTKCGHISVSRYLVKGKHLKVVTKIVSTLIVVRKVSLREWTLKK